MQPWHQTVLTIGIVTICALFNIFLSRRLPLTEGIVLVLHAVGVFVVAAPLWATAKKGNAHDTILSFSSNGGWEPLGLASIIGMVPMIGMLIVGSNVCTEGPSVRPTRANMHGGTGLRLFHTHVRGDKRCFAHHT